MRVHLFAAYHTLSGVRNFDLAIKPDDTIQTAINLIIERFPVLGPHWLDENGNLLAHLTIILNKVDASSLPEGLNTKLNGNDELDFLSPVGGGC